MSVIVYAAVVDGGGSVLVLALTLKTPN